MDPGTRWDAHFEASVAEISGGAVIDGETATVEVIGVPKQVVTRVLSSLDGKRDLDEVAARAGVPLSHVTAICSALREASLIHGAEDSDRTVPHDDFAELSRRVFAAWKKRLFGHPLWRGLVDGNAPAVQFAGWLMENYHFIEGVNDRLGSATAYCRSRQARRHFARHYREEYDHSEFFIQALLALGFTRNAVYASRPLASTRGIINHMRRCARQDSLFYARVRVPRVDRWRSLECPCVLQRRDGELCKDRPGIVTPLVDHLELDGDYGHNGVIERLGPHLGIISHSRASAALQAVYTLVEVLELWSSDIIRHYTDDRGDLRARAYGYRRSVHGGSVDGGWQ